MNINQLSHKYYLACKRVSDVAEKLYEDIHTNGGHPITDEDVIRKKITDAIKEIRSELDLIKSAIAEYDEYHSS